MPDALPPASAVAALIEGRRTIHRFDPARPVPPDALRRAVALATAAPNHKLTEPWRFVALGPERGGALVALNADVVRARSGDEAAENKRRRWAEVPVFLVALARRSDADALRAREDYAAVAVAVHNLSLYLWAEGIGTKWTTGPVTRDARFAALVGFDPAAEDVVGLLHVGYPAEVPPPPPRTRADVFTEHP